MNPSQLYAPQLMIAVQDPYDVARTEPIITDNLRTITCHYAKSQTNTNFHRFSQIKFCQCMALTRCLPTFVRNHSFVPGNRSEENTSELQSHMRNSYADFCI